MRHHPVVLPMEFFFISYFRRIRIPIQAANEMHTPFPFFIFSLKKEETHHSSKVIQDFLLFFGAHNRLNATKEKLVMPHRTHTTMIPRQASQTSPLYLPSLANFDMSRTVEHGRLFFNNSYENYELSSYNHFVANYAAPEREHRFFGNIVAMEVSIA